MASQAICAIDGCGKAAKKRGWCDPHYKRWWRHGDPIAGTTPKGAILKWVQDVALTHEADECLTWPFYRKADGRGVAHLGKGRSRLVHRFVCEEVNGPPPTDDHVACHSCGNGHLGCVAPGHLYWGTRLENQQDMIGHGRSQRGEKAAGALLTETDVRNIRALQGTMRQKDIAERYGVSIMAVNDILKRRTWAWLHTSEETS